MTNTDRECCSSNLTSNNVSNIDVTNTKSFFSARTLGVCGCQEGSVLSGRLCCTGMECSPPPLHPNAYSPSYMVDDDSNSYWISTPNLENVVVSLDLQSLIEIKKIEIQFQFSRPHSFILEKSVDGNTFSAYQFYSDSCEEVFG